MTIPISPIASLPILGSVSGVGATSPAASVPDVGSSSGSDFASVLGKGLDSLQATQSTADTLAVKAATGDLADISSYTIAASQASLATSLAATLRTKAVDAFNEIMGLQA